MTTSTCNDDLVISAKQGSTFHWAGTVNLPTGTWTAQSSVTQQGTSNPFGDLTVILGAPVSDLYTIDIFADTSVTSLWNVPKLSCDILFIDSSTPPNVVPTLTFTIDIERQVTIRK